MEGGRGAQDDTFQVYLESEPCRWGGAEVVPGPAGQFIHPVETQTQALGKEQAGWGAHSFAEDWVGGTQDTGTRVQIRSPCQFAAVGFGSGQSRSHGGGVCVCARVCVELGGEALSSKRTESKGRIWTVRGAKGLSESGLRGGLGGQKSC